MSPPDLLPRHLRANLPQNAQSQVSVYEGSIVSAMAVPWGTPLRDAINKSYDDTLRILLIAAIVFQAANFLLTLLLPDFDLKAVDEVRDYGGLVVGNVRDSMAKQQDTKEMAEDSASKNAENKEIAV